jgi:hypothetical protein
MLFSLVQALEDSGSLATDEGVRVVEELVTILLSAEDEDAVTVQRRLRDATVRAFGDEDPRTLTQERNLGVVVDRVSRATSS